MNSMIERIGGSQAAAACGESKYKTRYQLWLELTGQAEEENNDSLWIPARCGLALESLILDLFTETTGLSVKDQQVNVEHPDHNWMCGTLDGMIVNENAGVDAKSIEFEKQLGPTGDILPSDHLFQGQHYMACTGADAWYFAYLIGKRDIRVIRLMRDDDFIAEMIRLESNLMQCVRERTRPPLISHSEYKMVEAEEIVEAPEDIARAVHALTAVRRQIKDFKEQESLLAERIQSFMKTSTILNYRGEPLVTWRFEKSNRLDTPKLKKEEPDTYRRFQKTTKTRTMRIKNGKPTISETKKRISKTD